MKSSLLAFLAIMHLALCANSKDKLQREINYDSIKRVLEVMFDEDQNIRRILEDSIGFDSPEAGPFIKKMMQIDDQNQKNLQLILGKYGWIEQSKIGKKAAGAIFYIIQHSNMELMDKWYPEFKKLVDRGEGNPRQCAMMEDRLLMWKGKKQIYGTQASDFRPDKKMAIWPIEDPAHVNDRRKKIGFESSVEEYAKGMDALYDPNDQLPVKKN